MTEKLFVTCGQDLETLLQEELAELGYPETTRGFRGVYVPFNSFETVYRINYCSRLATRVLMPLAKFRCQNKEALYREALKLDWATLVPPNSTFAIDANVTHPALRNSLFAAQLVKDAICDRHREAFQRRPSVDTGKPDVQINLFIRDFTGIISLDTSGAPLHKRGYRIEGGLAPLHETLAAALLKLAGYTGNEDLYDPCCGSGTLLIEAALLATNTPPGFFRKEWGFMKMPGYKHEEWLAIKNAADAEKRPLKSRFIGTDISKDAVRIAKTNLRAAGLLSSIDVTQCDFREFSPPFAPEFIITNPPHGIRLGEETALIPLYRSLGDWMKLNGGKKGTGAVFTANPLLAKNIGLASKRKIPLFTGGEEARLLLFDIFPIQVE